MTDIAKLGLEVDSRPVDRAATALDRFERSGGRAERSADRLGRVYSRATASLRLFAGGLFAAVSASAALNAATRYQEATNNLRVLGLSGSQAAERLNQIAEVANRTRAPLEATAQLYQRVSIASQELGASQSQVLQFTENVGLALAQQGGSAAAASGALTQLSQALAGGTVRAEEFNSILEGAYPIALAAAEGIDEAGGSVARLRQLVIEGEISSSEFFNAILSQGEALQATFEQTTPTVAQAFTQLGNSVTMFVGELDAATGTSNLFATGVSALATAVRTAGQYIDQIVAVLQRAATYAATAAVIFGGRLAARIALAAAKTVTFSGALTVLRGALIRTGIGALIVGAGELVYQFTRLVQAAGGFGGAVSLLGDVVSEVWQRIGYGALAMQFRIQATWQEIRASILGALAGILDGVSTLANRIIGAFVGAHGAVVATWQALPAAFAQVGAMAINSLIDVLQDGLNGVAGVVNDFLSVFDVSIAAPDLSDWRVEVGETVSVVETAQSAFSEAFNQDYVGPYVSTLGDLSEEARNSAETIRGLSNVFSDAATGPLQSWQRLQQTVAQAEAETDDATGAAQDYEQALIDAGSAGAASGDAASGGAGRAAQATRSAIQAIRDEIEQRRELLSIAGQSEDRIAAVRRVEEALAQDRADWSRERIDQLANELITLERQEEQIKSMRGLYSNLIDSIAAGDISGGLKSFWSDFKTQGTKAWSNLLKDSFAQGGGGFSAIFSGLKGAWGKFTSSLSGIGGSIGSIFSGIGGALSAALPIVGAVTGIISLIKGFSTKKLVGAGVGGTLGGDATDAYSYQRIKKSSFWGLFSKTRTYNTAQDELSGQLGLEVANIQDSVTSLIDVMGGAASDISAITHSFKFDTRNMSEEQIQERLQEELEAYGNAIASTALGTDEFTRQGESALEAVTRMATGLQAANTAFEALGLHLYDTSLAGADAASALVELFGSLENFTQATDFYYQNFYSEQERLDFTTRKLTETLNDLGFSTVPQTRAQFRMLVEGMREIGDNEGLATLLQIAPAFVEIENAVSSMLESNVTNAENALRDAEQAAKNAYDAAISAIESERDAVIDHWQAMLDEVADATETASKRASEALRIAGIIFDAQQSALEQAFNAVETNLTTLIDTAADAAKETSTVLGLLDRALENRSSTRTEELARSQALALVQGGDTSDQSRLEQALSTLNEPSDQLFGSYVEYARDYARTTAAISELRDQTAEQLTTEEQIVATLEAQLDAERSAYEDQAEYLDQQLAAMEAQIDLLNGIDNTLQGAITAIYGSNIDLASAMSDEFGGQARVIEFVEAAIRELADAREEERITQEAADAQIAVAESQAARQIEALNETVQGILNLDTTILTVTQSIDDLDAAITGLSSAQIALATAQEQFDEAQLREAQIQNQLTAELLAISQEQERVRQIAALQEQLAKALAQIGDQPLVLRIVQEVGRGSSWFRDKASYVRLNNGQTFSSKSGGTASELAHARAQAQAPIAASEAAFAAWQAARTSIVEPLRRQIVSLGGVPQFADGGFHSGGLRIVGERGAEVEATGPARLYSNKQTREMFRDPDLVQEVARLRKEVSDLRGENRAGQAQIAKNTGRVAALARKQDIEGTPPVREEA